LTGSGAILLLADSPGCVKVRAAQRVHPPAPSVEVRRDVTYFEGPASEAQRHRLDLYLPAARNRFPLLLFIHGGAWKSGSKDLYGYLGRTFAGRGIGVAVANYRLSPAVKHPEHIRDVARAFAWVAHHAADLGTDPARLFLVGHSAGAHLAALLALDPRYLQEQGVSPERICGVVGISGPYALAPGWFNDVFGDDPQRRADAFPLSHVRDHAPPFLLLYADRDFLGLPAAAKLLEASLRQHGDTVTLKEIPDRDHITIVSKIAMPGDPTAGAILHFVNLTRGK
jgi:acetyl esterase/lipase